jgi:hypothetical protein
MQTAKLKTRCRPIDEANDRIRTQMLLRCAAELAQVKGGDGVVTADCVVGEQTGQIIRAGAPQIVEAALIRAELEASIVVP